MLATYTARTCLKAPPPSRYWPNMNVTALRYAVHIRHASSFRVYCLLWRCGHVEMWTCGHVDMSVAVTPSLLDRVQASSVAIRILFYTDLTGMIWIRVRPH
jgi:hypothetical protein